jgi:hypothetical protein
MSAHQRRRIGPAVAVALALACVALVQGRAQLLALRLRGSVLAGSGAPIEGARVRAEALLGMAGLQFVGQREFGTRTNRNGQWAIVGILRGAWSFSVSAAGYLPHLVAVPVEMMQASNLQSPPWELSLHLQAVGDVVPADRGAEAWARLLTEAADAAVSGRPQEAAGRLAALREQTLGAEAQCAAGDIALVIRDVSSALGFFDAAAHARPEWYRPHLGLASASLFIGDFDRAVAAYAKARDATKNADLQRTLSAALRDLQKIMRTVR